MRGAKSVYFALYSSDFAFQTYPFDIFLFLKTCRNCQSLDPSFSIRTPGYPVFTDVLNKVNCFILMFLGIRDSNLNGSTSGNCPALDIAGDKTDFADRKMNKTEIIQNNN
jgi:hypothetical protein